MKKHKKYIPHEVHFFFAIFAFTTSLIVVWNQYFNSEEHSVPLWDFIDPLVIFVLLLVAVFHIFEGIQEKTTTKTKKKK